MKTFRITLFSIAFCASTLLAQENTASISGQVLDSSGAAVPAARVIAHSPQTGLDRATATADNGNYTIPLLPLGAWEVSVEKDGFKKSVQTGITLQIDQRARVDFQLQVGAASE